MSDEDKSNDEFPDFKGKPDVEEDGFTTSELGIGIGFVLLAGGFILGLISLLALNGDSNQADFNNNLEQLSWIFTNVCWNISHNCSRFW